MSSAGRISRRHEGVIDMFRSLGLLISRHPLLVVCLWLVGAAGIVYCANRFAVGHVAEPDSYLPAHSDQRLALTRIAEAFPELSSRSQLVIVANRPNGLTEADFKYLASLAEAIRAEGSEPGRNWKVLSPVDGFLRKRLVSSDKEAALMVVNLNVFFASKAAREIVERIETLARTSPPEGLQVELTGAVAGARDYGTAMRVSLQYTKYVTIGFVLFILLAVYRSPLAAGIPIIGIGVCTWLALCMLELLGLLGLSVSDLERMFTIVLLYGAGTDFAMFWMARYREEWMTLGPDGRREAAAIATQRVGPAIVASAGTTILGLLSLIATQMIPTQNAGKALGAVLCWAPLAGVTLIPAVVCLMGRAVFWPMGLGDVKESGRIWPALGRMVVRRPVLTLLLGFALLLPAAVRAGFLEFRYDTLSELPPGSSSESGAAIAHKHFEPGVLYPITCLLRTGEGKVDDQAMQAMISAVSEAALKVEGVGQIFSAVYPLGSHNPVEKGITGTILLRASRQFYISGKQNAARMEIILHDPPFSRRAMAAAQRVREAIKQTTAKHSAGIGSNVEVHIHGATPYILEVRRFMDGDQWRVWIGATVLIWIAVVALVRQVGLSLFMVGATLITYATTLGLSHEFFVHVMGTGGLDYKVKLFLFVIIVAVGQDYNIFLVSRLRQEVDAHGDEAGVQRAIVRTGGVISSCGLIMAATLGSLWVGRLELLRQLGFALALGMLIDTFIVRPLMVPSFWLCVRRWRKSAAQTNALQSS